MFGIPVINPFRVSSSATKTITLKNADGSVSGTISISSSSRNKSKKKLKKVPYSFKQISTQILRTKKPAAAGQVVSSARQVAASLRRMMYTGKYDDEELRHAAEHAERMVRIAKKRKKHLQEEENAKGQGGVCQADLEEQNNEDTDALWQGFLSDDNSQAGMSAEDLMMMSAEQMEELLREAQEQIQDLMEEMEMMETEALSEEELTVSRVNMDPEDLEALKKKHRAEELKEILEADMEYLKAMFNKYQQERKNAGSQSSSGNSGGSSDSYGSSEGVSLELGGTQMPVSVSAQEPVMVEGANMDTMV